ncbi:TerC family protein [Arenicella xantha]|uniref:Putative tellurium resistance membrane protein TerC n=1 Tax=Arenicella xantha TaxID=644221 RepID=A0A395JUC5_9GAMM|nr:tellurium resistance protein TerC [Arenicella xantha]RBP53148.1 putative tellurium resistance membrane protein TerC [Arenicella xantha]
MAEIFTLVNLVDLLLLVLLQAVLGFDNLLYISLESKRAPLEKQKAVRFWGIIIAVALRIILLFLLLNMIKAFQNELFAIHWEGIIHATFTLHAIIVLFGGVFILYTAMKEILHMMSLEDINQEERSNKSIGFVIFWIVAMNVVFSFDSILSAMAVTKVFAVMATAILIGGILMVALADTVSDFLTKNRMYEVLGLFILFLVGVMLLSEGGHLAHMQLFGNPIEQMSKTTFYFVLFVLIISDIVQSRYQRKLNIAKKGVGSKTP